MSRNRYISAIDLGSSNIRVMIAETVEEGREELRVIGVGEVPSYGMRKGVVSDADAIARCVSEAVEKAEVMAGVSVKEAVVSMSGPNVKTQTGKGVVAVGKADGEVMSDDVERVIASAGKTEIPLNYELIHIIPRAYRLDDQKGMQDPVGMQGVRLEVDAFVVVGFSPQIRQTRSILSACGIDVLEFVFAPLAAAEAVLDREQRELGVGVVDMGGMTTSVAVYEEGELLHCQSLGVGASHITNDVAIGLRTTISLAERVKQEYGTASIVSVRRDEDIDLEAIDPSEEGEVSRYHVVEIIEARLEEMLEKVTKELRSVERDRLLPAGVVLTGGGAHLPEVVDLAKKQLGLPVSLGYPRHMTGIIDKVDEPSYAVVSGLVHWQVRNEGAKGRGFVQNFVSNPFVGGLTEKLREWFKTFLP